jgi:hypothetical protein
VTTGSPQFALIAKADDSELWAASQSKPQGDFATARG